jgi:hypothetical protein
LAVTGRDSDHPRLDIPDSLALTNPITGASGTVPTIANRPGAEFVGVMIGQHGGEWVAVMTNKAPAVTPTGGAFEVFVPASPIWRYDSLLGFVNGLRIIPGIYTIQTLLKVGNDFVMIDQIDYDTSQTVTPILAGISYASLSNIYSLLLSAGLANLITPANFDFFIYFDNSRYFSILVPSRRTPPRLPTVFTQPSGGYGLDLTNWAGGSITLKWRLFTPEGLVYDSNEIVFAHGTFQPDNQYATITETSNQLTITRTFATSPSTGRWRTVIRAAVFRRPEGYNPILQSLLFATEDFASLTVVASGILNHPALNINRAPLAFRSYSIILDKLALPSGQYTLHVRHAVRRKIDEDDNQAIEEDESYFYDFTIPAPPEPPSGPPLAPDFCIPKIPAVAGESWDGLYRDENGDWGAFATTLTTCHLANYCTCFELVSEVPSAYIDIVGYFRGAVLGRPVPTNAKHKARFIGQIKRIADQYESENFVSSAYASEDIVRAYSERFEVELLIFDPCQLSHVDLLKFAEKCDVVNRNNRLLPSEIRNLKFEEVNIENDPKYARVRITLRRVKWRDEYRRNA